MLSKNTVKFIKSLQQKKFRKQNNAFFVEGTKNVTELLSADYKITHLLSTFKYLEDHSDLVAGCDAEIFEVGAKILQSVGSFLTNDSVLAVAEMKENLSFDLSPNELVLALDDIRDPGNLGTIIRIADWYGIKKLLLSEETADFYNPKVLNASMGSFTRIDVLYTDLDDYLSTIDMPIYGAYLEGADIHQTDLKPEGIVVMGNESRGISEKLTKRITHKLTIPCFGHAESLNVAVATAVICDNFRRSTNQKQDL